MRSPLRVTTARGVALSLLMSMEVKTRVVVLKKMVVSVTTIMEVKLPGAVVIRMVEKSKLLVSSVVPLVFVSLPVVAVEAVMVVVTLLLVVDWKSFLKI